MATATRKARDNKVTRVILPALYNTPGLTINEIVDPRTGKPVEALYFYQARGVDKDGNAVLDKDGQPVKPLIEQMDDVVRTGKPGRPAKRWKLTKATRDKMRKAEKRAQGRDAAIEKVADEVQKAEPTVEVVLSEPVAA
jgi:hypothetical protein